MELYEEHDRTLPVRGARLVKLSFGGNGKDAEATIEVDGGRQVVVPLDYGVMDLRLSGAALVKTRSVDDLDVLIEIVPDPECPLIVEEAEVQLPGSDEEWNEALRRFATEGRWSVPWPVRLRLRLAPMPR